MSKQQLSRLSFSLFLLCALSACISQTHAGSNEYLYLPLVVKPGSLTPQIAGCDVFPADNVWNTPIDHLPVHTNSANYIASIGASTGLHADFGAGVWPLGSDSPIGIPYVDVAGSQTAVTINFIWYPSESDPGPYPIPPNAPREGGPTATDGDRHVLVVDRDNCILYELYAAEKQPDDSWDAGSGAVYDLNSHTFRPDGWTSADAAGLPILPGLVRYDEVAAGEINHALRFTTNQTQDAYIWPARHEASSLTGSNYPPMGLRVRLRANFDTSTFPPDAQVILQAMKTYGMILADNGSPWYFSGAPDEQWDNDVLHKLDVVTGSDFEVVDTSSLIIDPDSGQAVQP
ncbi:MAG: hypothetical protein GY805_37520 [Chloroflexi bacterium]|nr:hypothetical protein [Chloroflexota bacterium]